MAITDASTSTESYVGQLTDASVLPRQEVLLIVGAGSGSATVAAIMARVRIATDGKIYCVFNNAAANWLFGTVTYTTV